MGAHHTGDLDRLLATIRASGNIFARDLSEACGIGQKRTHALLERKVNDGLVGRELCDAEGAAGQRRLIRYTWLGTSMREPRRQPRKCLGCGAEFSSAGPMNRLCMRCRTQAANVSPYAC